MGRHNRLSVFGLILYCNSLAMKPFLPALFTLPALCNAKHLLERSYLRSAETGVAILIHNGHEHKAAFTPSVTISSLTIEKALNSIILRRAFYFIAIAISR